MRGGGGAPLLLLQRRPPHVALALAAARPCRLAISQRRHRRQSCREILVVYAAAQKPAAAATVAATEQRGAPAAGLVVTELTPAAAPKVLRLGPLGGTDSGGWTTAAGLGDGDSAAAAAASGDAGKPPRAASAAAGASGGGPMAALAALFLPEGYPASVTPDYLPYQLASVPTHVTGWLSHSLATSSLLRAVGIDAGPAGTAAASAAIRWIAKDGIGAAGRALVGGGRLGREFDDDPRRWRMAAEAVTTLGLALEISTALAPAYFLPLASAGNFAKALAKGVGKPVFRVVQTHFAAAGNVGAVAAKEEVWEVAAQLAGYAASVAALKALEEAAPESWVPVVALWAAVQGAHVALRYNALGQLRFAGVNHKRACALASAHVAAVLAREQARGHGSSSSSSSSSSSRNNGGGGDLILPLPGVDAVNRAEPMLAPASSVSPQIRFGVSFEEAWGASVAGAAPAAAAAWAEAYAGEAYLLAASRGGGARVAVKAGAAPRDLLRAVWQAAWLEAHAGGADGRGRDIHLDMLRQSLAAAREHEASFFASLAAAGWDVDAQPVTLQMQGPTRVVVEQPAELAAAAALPSSPLLVDE